MSAFKTFLKLAGTGAVIALATGGAIAADDPPRPAVVDALYLCRDIADPEARLACYDARVREMADADQRRDILFADREQVKRTKKGLFGLDLSNLNIFGTGRDDDADEEVRDITAKITGLQVVDRKLTLTLDDGARWVQVDSKNLPRRVRAGMEIKIRRAALGSYLANIDGMNAIRVKRVN